LRDLIDDLLNAKAVLLDLSRLTYPLHRNAGLGIEFQGKAGHDKLRQWNYSERLNPIGSPQAVKRPSTVFLSTPPELEQPSKSQADLERFRAEALRHLKLFREVVAEVDPEWWRKHQGGLQTMERWVRSWTSFETERWPEVPGEGGPELSTGEGRRAPPKYSENLSVSLFVDETFLKKLRQKFGQPGVCEVSPMTVHFNLDRPRSLSDDRGVLPDPAEVDRAAEELKRIIDTARVKLRFTVRGRTDSSGSTSRNDALSVRRAQWLLDRLRRHPLGLNLRNAKVIGDGERLAIPRPEVNPAERIAVITVEPAS
jgi:hypothetical protein